MKIIELQNKLSSYDNEKQIEVSICGLTNKTESLAISDVKEDTNTTVLLILDDKFELIRKDELDYLKMKSMRLDELEQYIFMNNNDFYNKIKLKNLNEY